MAQRWGVRRSAARRAVVLAYLALVAATTFLLVGISGYSAVAATSGLRAFVAAAGPRDAALALQTPLAAHPAAQQLAATTLFARQFGSLPVTVEQSLTLPPVAITATSRSAGHTPSGDPTIRVAAYPTGFDDHARIVAGRWPATATAGHPVAALPQTAATRLGLRVGDSITVGPLTATVAAIWAPTRDQDPYFVADAAGANGESALAADTAAIGLLVVSPAVLEQQADSAHLNFTIVPDASRITPGDINAVAAAVAATPDALLADQSVAPGGALSYGDLPGTLATVQLSLQAAYAVGPVPALLVAAISLLMFGQLARLLTLERRAETALVRSRGASAGQLTRLAAAEAAGLTVPAAAIGLLAATLFLSAVGGGLTGTGWALAGAVVVVAGAVLVIPAARSARATANRQQIDDSGRVRVLTTGGTILLVLLAAAVALWRFRRAGSAAVVDAQGHQHLDPIAVLAPALVLLGAALVAGLVFGLAAALAEVVTARRRGLAAVLAARQVARRGTVFGIVVLLAAISVGSAVLAAAYATTQRTAQQQTDALRNGAPLLATLPTVDPMLPGSFADLTAKVGATPGVATAVAAEQLPASLGDQDAQLTAVPMSELEHITPGSPAAGLAGALARPLTGVPLPAGTTDLAVGLAVASAWHGYGAGAYTSNSDGTITYQPGPSTVATDVAWTIWLATADGAVQPVSAGSSSITPEPTGSGAAHPVTVHATLPALPAGTRLVGIDADLPATTGGSVYVALTLTGLTAGHDDRSAPVQLQGRWGVPFSATDPNSASNASIPIVNRSDGRGGGTATPAGQTGVIRLTPLDSRPLPIAITPQAAAANNLRVGSSVTLSLGSARPLAAVVAVITAAIPGVGAATSSATTTPVAADLAAVSGALLRSTANLPAANQIWINPASVDPTVLASTIAAGLPATATLSLADSRSTEALLAPSGRMVWLGAAGALLLAAIGLVSVVASVNRSRTGELVALRASGVTARRQARGRTGELALTVLCGWLLGVAVGFAAVLTTTSAMAGSAVVGSLGLDPALRFDWRTAALLVGGHVVLVGLVLAGNAMLLRRSVLAATPSEVHQA